MIEEEMTPYEKEEKERQKQAKIEYTKKKKFSAIFMTLACVFEIIETLIVMLLLLVGVAFLFTKVIHVEGKIYDTIMTICMIVVFFGGLVLGFIIYKKLVTFVIKKFKLEDKLIDDVIIHYKKESKEQRESRLKR
ncbi:MAG: hypothetical protein K6G09_01900 [Treponema sp.]|jgi:magnesium-transporting ATPase (P-type)|nr:hypothetical protein [Treponema sp.]